MLGLGTGLSFGNSVSADLAPEGLLLDEDGLTALDEDGLTIEED